MSQRPHPSPACRMSAENEIQQLCNTMTQSADPLISRADLLYAKGRCDEAVHLLTDSLARNPSQADVVTRLAEFLIDSGWHARALEFLKNTNADENNVRALLLRGLCHEALGNFACAEDIADQLLAQDRQRANALALKARIAAGVSGERQSRTALSGSDHMRSGLRHGLVWACVSAAAAR